MEQQLRDHHICAWFQGYKTSASFFQETVARLCSRLHFPERFLSAYARLLACRLLPEWVTWGLSGRQGPLECDKLVSRLDRIPIHVRLARARRAAGNNHAAYMAFFESTDAPESQREVGSVDVFSGVAAAVCALELRVWEAIQHAFEARCPVPPEEQWRVRQVISDIAAARETLLLYTRHVRQKKNSLASRAAAVSSNVTATEASRAVDTAQAGAGQQLEHRRAFLHDRHEVDSEPTFRSTVSTGRSSDRSGRFEALVLTKTAWETYLPLAAPEVSRLPPQQMGSDVLPGRLTNHLVNVGGLKIPKELHTYLEVSLCYGLRGVLTTISLARVFCSCYTLDL